MVSIFGIFLLRPKCSLKRVLINSCLEPLCTSRSSNTCTYSYDSAISKQISYFDPLEIYCPALEPPFRGSISPSSCTDDRANIQRDTACTYGCESGHYVTGGNNSLTCQIDGFWQGTVPYCKRKSQCASMVDKRGL